MSDLEIPDPSSSQAAEPALTDEHAKMIEAEVQKLWTYVENAFTEARRECQNTLQWLFGLIAGGVGLASQLWDRNWQVALALVTGAGWSSWVAYELLRAHRSKLMEMPGFYASAINTAAYLDLPAPELRAVLATGLDDRIQKNKKVVGELASAVDDARFRFSLVAPVCVGAFLIFWIGHAFFSWLSNYF